MEYISEEIEVSTCSLYGERFAHFNFIGRLIEETCLKFCSAWKREFKKTPSDKTFVFIWDCTEMKGFDTEARKQLIKSVRFHEHQISSVIVISESTLFRTADRLMLKLFFLQTCPCCYY